MLLNQEWLFINLGVPELSIIVLLVLILFGPGKLPGVMKSLGDGVRQFKDASTRIASGESEKPSDVKKDTSDEKSA